MNFENTDEAEVGLKRGASLIRCYMKVLFVYFSVFFNLQDESDLKRLQGRYQFHLNRIFTLYSIQNNVSVLIKHLAGNKNLYSFISDLEAICRQR